MFVLSRFSRVDSCDPTEPASLALAGGLFTTEPPGKLRAMVGCSIKVNSFKVFNSSIYL